MPVAGQSVARGSSQIGPPSYQTIICQGFVKGAAQSAGSSLMKMASANFTSDSSGNYNDTVGCSTAFDSNSSGDAGSGAFDYSNSGGFDTSGIQGGFLNIHLCQIIYFASLDSFVYAVFSFYISVLAPINKIRLLCMQSFVCFTFADDLSRFDF